MSGFLRCVGVAAVLLLACGMAGAEDWPKLSGPHNNWTSTDKGLANQRRSE